MVIDDHNGAHNVSYSFKPNHNPWDWFYLQILQFKNVSTNKYTSIRRLNLKAMPKHFIRLCYCSDTVVLIFKWNFFERWIVWFMFLFSSCDSEISSFRCFLVGFFSNGFLKFNFQIMIQICILICDKFLCISCSNKLHKAQTIFSEINLHCIYYLNLELKNSIFYIL